MKQGTNVGLDKNYNNVCVGDKIKDEAGNEYIINAYGLAVDEYKGGTKKLTELKGVEVVKTEAVESKAAPPPERRIGESQPGQLLRGGCARRNAGGGTPKAGLHFDRHQDSNH